MSYHPLTKQLLLEGITQWQRKGLVQKSKIQERIVAIGTSKHRAAAQVVGAFPGYNFKFLTHAFPFPTGQEPSCCCQLLAVLCAVPSALWLVPWKCLLEVIAAKIGGVAPALTHPRPRFWFMCLDPKLFWARVTNQDRDAGLTASLEDKWVHCRYPTMLHRQYGVAFQELYTITPHYK